jgi:hypothetical protein
MSGDDRSVFGQEVPHAAQGLNGIVMSPFEKPRESGGRRLYHVANPKDLSIRNPHDEVSGSLRKPEVTHLYDPTTQIDADHIRHNNIGSSCLYPFYTFPLAHKANHETTIILEMLVHVTLRGRMLNDDRTLWEHVVSVGMVTVVARVSEEADGLCRYLADEPNELRCEIAIQHRLNHENATLADHEAGCSRDMVFVKYVIGQYRKYAGG